MTQLFSMARQAQQRMREHDGLHGPNLGILGFSFNMFMVAPPEILVST
jgi:hypothetical protein